MNKKKSNIFFKIMMILFIIFMGLFIANISGYYESKIHDKVVMTEEGIKAFETKISNGEEIDIKSFLNNTRVDYSSKMSNLGDDLTNSFGNLVDKSAKVFADIFKSLF